MTSQQPPRPAEVVSQPMSQQVAPGRSVEVDVQRLADIRASLQDIQRRKSAPAAAAGISKFSAVCNSVHTSSFSANQQSTENIYQPLHAASSALFPARQQPFAQRDLNKEVKTVKHASKPLTPLLSQKPWKSNSPGPALAKSPNSAGMPSFQVLADVAAADAFAAKGASDIDARQMQATLRSLVADAVKNSTAQTDSSPPANAQQAMLRYALARHGEVAIDLQRVGNHCKDIAAELHKVKADIKERTPLSTTLQLKQRNAALSDQLQQTATRERALHEEVKQHKAAAVNARDELQQAQEVCREMLAARRSAREALSDMAQQNARLVSAYVEKKQELRHLQDNIREERLQWQMRVEELEAVCHAASFESSLRRAMAHTSPVCSVSASTDSNDSSQSFIRAEHDADQADAATSSFQAHSFGTSLRSNGTDRQHSFGTGFRQTAHGQDSGSLDADEEEYLRRDADSMSQSSSETEISGLKQQQREWETEREELLREMGNLRFQVEMSKVYSASPSSHAPSTSQQTGIYAEGSSASLGTPGLRQHAPSPFPKAAYAPADHFTSLSQQARGNHHGFSALYRGSQAEASQAGSAGAEPSLQTRGLQAELSPPAAAAGQNDGAVPPRQGMGEAQGSGTGQPQSPRATTSSDTSGGVDTPKTLRLKAMAAQTERLQQENAELRQQQTEVEARSRKADDRQKADAYKQAGNAFFQQQRHQQAADEYSKAIEVKVDDQAFNAVLYCNRAAAYHAMSKYIDAIADCFTASALDASYVRVLQRRADAYVAIGDHTNAAQDLLLLSQKGGGNVSAELMEVQRKAKANGAVNHYRVLGLQQTALPTDVKVSYRFDAGHCAKLLCSDARPVFPGRSFMMNNWLKLCVSLQAAGTQVSPRQGHH
ncbi:TPA: hypothetical protein ACH3X3_005714 [Trebouxia sp. C0006]